MFSQPHESHATCCVSCYHYPSLFLRQSVGVIQWWVCHQQGYPVYLAERGKARGCSTSSFVIHSLSNQPFPPTTLWRRHAQTVRDRSFSYKIDYVIGIKNILYPEAHQNPIRGSKVTAILLKGRIFSFCGVASGRVCAYRLRSWLVFFNRPGVASAVLQTPL